MEAIVKQLEVSTTTDAVNKQREEAQTLKELSNLELALVGGGVADVFFA